MQQQAIGTYTAAGTVHHLQAGLTIEQARKREAAARAFYARVRKLQDESGCDTMTAVLAIQDADGRGQR
jgi:hypothetical protein